MPVIVIACIFLSRYSTPIRCFSIAMGIVRRVQNNKKKHAKLTLLNHLQKESFDLPLFDLSRSMCSITADFHFARKRRDLNGQIIPWKFSSLFVCGLSSPMDLFRLFYFQMKINNYIISKYCECILYNVSKHRKSDHLRWMNTLSRVVT